MDLTAQDNNISKVLIIEDDTHLRRALSYFLKQKGLSVEEAMTGEEGLALFIQTKPDIIIIDNSLPGKMGYEVCREIREIEPHGSNLPIVMISAFMKVLGLETNEREETNLVDDFLRKPFQLEQLWITLSKMRVSGKFTRPSKEEAKDPLVDEMSVRVESPIPSMPIKGYCKQYPFIELLSRGLASQSTGILTLREDKRVRRLYFANGFPVFARSNLIKESLLRYLLQNHVIDVDIYRKHLSKMQRERWRPGATLVREGVLTLTKLNQSHQMLVEYIIKSCLDWDAAEFDFVTSQVPVEQAVVYNINPFLLINNWLESRLSGEWLWHKMKALGRGRLKPTAHFSSWHHMLEWALSGDLALDLGLQGEQGIESLFKGEAGEVGLKRARFILMLILLKAVEVYEHTGERLESGELLREMLAVMAVSAAGSGASTSSELDVGQEGESWGDGKRAEEKQSAEQKRELEKGSPMESASVSQEAATVSQGGGATNVQRVYEMVLKDYRRVHDAGSPYDILRVSRNEPIAIIRKRYEQFERFYRPDNFSRLGDEKLYRLAVEIRQAMARAMVEIEAGTMGEKGGRDADSSGFGRRVGWGSETPVEDPLAQIFFNDGLTYLRISEHGEAVAHFQRSIDLMPNKASFRAYLVWGEFLREGRSREAATRAKQGLERWLEQYPEEDTIYHFLAHIHREDGDLEKAVSYYRRAAELNPNNRSAKLFLQRLSES